MANDVQPPVSGEEVADQFICVVERIGPSWVRRLVTQTAHDLPIVGDLDALQQQVTKDLIAKLRALFATDVDAQRTNPLSLFRAATKPITELLQANNIPPVTRDRFTSERFPDDIYDLVPASFAEIDPQLQPVGLAWGAWKAITVLQRRRAEGLR